jgi:hypothetical protein
LKPKPGDSPVLRKEKASAKGLKAMHHGGAKRESKGARRHEGGMKNAMHRGESGDHMNVGAHEGYVMGSKKR